MRRDFNGDVVRAARVLVSNVAKDEGTWDTDFENLRLAVEEHDEWLLRVRGGRVAEP